MVPYLPFFSNCQNFGSYIYFNDLLETISYCTLIDESETIPIKSFAMFTTPKSDVCELLLQCKYEEDLSFGTTKKIWFSHLSISTLFYITSSPISYSKYFNDKDALTEEVANYGEFDKLAVTVTRSDDRGLWNLRSDM